MLHSLRSSFNDLPQALDANGRPACGSAWGLVASRLQCGQVLGRAIPTAPAVAKSGRESQPKPADQSSFSMSGFG